MSLWPHDTAKASTPDVPGHQNLLRNLGNKAFAELENMSMVNSRSNVLATRRKAAGSSWKSAASMVGSPCVPMPGSGASTYLVASSASCTRQSLRRIHRAEDGLDLREVRLLANFALVEGLHCDILLRADVARSRHLRERSLRDGRERLIAMRHQRIRRCARPPAI